MLIKQKENGNKGMFYIGDENEPLAELSYTMAAPEKMIIEHTEVSDQLKGKNIGYHLVVHAVEYARANQIKIFPFCTFANSVFKKKKELRDVLA